ncbi:HupE/UreJ family protein [Pseudofulvibacter geojedonensis]|uniref:HupE/UreJ family protein n=1 Tax=Pseudofulvibacter geojedonensis TaxID=1123758 RepID=A0ABW3I3Q0_9FLAO
MEQFKLFLELGLTHVLDINGYDHVLFLMVLAAPYLFSNWKKILLLVTVFTVGHTLSLILAAFEVVSVKSSLVEFLIPVTIGVAAVYNIITAGKNQTNDKVGVLFFTTLFFGVIHGLGFSNYFRMIIGRSEEKIVPLLEFALGIEIAQVLIVVAMLILATLFQTFLRVTRKDWVLVVSSIVIGLIIPMLLER